MTTTTHRPPGPTGLARLRFWSEVPRRPFEVWRGLAAEYGDVVDVPWPVPGKTATLISHPDHVKHVMVSNLANYPKAAPMHEISLGEPAPMVIQEGEGWKRRRMAANPFFGEKALASVTGTIVDAVTPQVDKFRKHVDHGGFVDLEREFGLAVMPGLLGSMFSFAPDDETLAGWVEANRDLGRYFVGRMVFHGVPPVIPRPHQRTGEAALRYLLGEVDDMIARRRAEPPREKPDLLDVLMDFEFEGTPEEQYRALRAEIGQYVFAGFETTAAALAWTIALLCRNPGELGKAYDEVDALGGAPITYESIEKLPYLRAAFDEAQRLQGLPFWPRTALDDDEIGGYFIPKGSLVGPSAYVLQRDPRFWRDPEVFDPERFLNEDINRFAFIPFAMGARKCIGSRLAYIQGTVTLATVLQRYAFELKEGWTPVQAPRASTGMVGGLPTRLYLR